MRPPYSQSSRENTTPYSGTSPIASYKEVPSPPGENSVGDHSKCEGIVVSYGGWSLMSNMCTDMKLN